MQGMEVEDQPWVDRVTDAGLTTVFVLGATARGATARGATARGATVGAVATAEFTWRSWKGFTVEASVPPLATDSTGAIISGTGGVRFVACDTPAVRFGTGVGKRPSVGIATG